MVTETQEVPSVSEEEQLELRFSHNVIEHLGLKLYQNKPTNVLAELVSNSWDADATCVWIDLLTDSHGKPSAIAVADNGSGMSTRDLASRYLIVGHQKRDKNKPAQKSEGGRDLMGRKGIGKLAPFGVARQIDLITAKDGKATWLRFDYGEILKQSENNQEITRYKPKKIYINANLELIDAKKHSSNSSTIDQFLTRISKSTSGTLVLATELTVKRPITPTALKESLGRRFTVTLTRPDFDVIVNDLRISESDALPEWELRIPASGHESDFITTPEGRKEVKYWVGFVKSASWPHEQAGAGIYAHGKIAQDRPFFFGNKGNEIFSRYMYAVIEADWIDELSRDTISTDRTSIGWEDEDLTPFFKWGEQKVKSWIAAYERHRKATSEGENSELVERVITKNSSLQIRPTEKSHLINLLSEVTPKLGKASEDKEKLVEATVKAWVHEPARRLIKKLWEDASKFDARDFATIVTQLSDQLVPESLSLAVVFAQRVYALTRLEQHIMHGKETQLQKLIEEFPWILDNQYEDVYPRKSLKTLCDEAEQKGLMQHRNVHLSNNSDYTKPDFVFFGDTSNRKILIVELKSPNDTAGWEEYQQLLSYISYLQSRFTDATVEGVLVARSFDIGIEKQKLPTMKYTAWPDLLLRSRRDHMSMLAALLAGTDADARDARVQQICELGGDSVQEFLRQMGEHSEELQKLSSQLDVQARAGGNA